MTRFFFDTGDKGDLTRDVTGLELPNLEAARLEAIKALPGIACELLAQDCTRRRDITADVRDRAGHRLFTAHLVFEARWLD